MSAITPLATAKADMVRASTAMQRTASAHGVRRRQAHNRCWERTVGLPGGPPGRSDRKVRLDRPAMLEAHWMSGLRRAADPRGQGSEGGAHSLFSIEPSLFSLPEFPV